MSERTKKTLWERMREQFVAEEEDSETTPTPPPESASSTSSLYEDESSLPDLKQTQRHSLQSHLDRATQEGQTPATEGLSDESSESDMAWEDDTGPSPEDVNQPSAEEQIEEQLQALHTLDEVNAEGLTSYEQYAISGLHAVQQYLHQFVASLESFAGNFGEDIEEELGELQHRIDWVSYFTELLEHLHSDGECVYTDPFGDEITFTTIEAWMDSFSVNLLDPMAEYLYQIEREGYKGFQRQSSAKVRDVHHILMTQSIPLILIQLDFQLVQSFPRLTHNEQIMVTPENMKVVAQESLHNYNGCVVGTKMVGLIRDRRVYRIASVVTG